MFHSRCTLLLTAWLWSRSFAQRSTPSSSHHGPPRHHRALEDPTLECTVPDDLDNDGVNDFSGLLLLKLVGHHPVSLEEVTTMEEVMAEIYHNLTGECTQSGVIRELTNVEIIPDVSFGIGSDHEEKMSTNNTNSTTRRLDAITTTTTTGKSLLLEQDPQEFFNQARARYLNTDSPPPQDIVHPINWLARLSGICNGCEAGEGLFDHGSSSEVRRHLLQTTHAQYSMMELSSTKDKKNALLLRGGTSGARQLDSSRLLQETCQCPGPTFDSFSESLQGRVRTLIDAGDLPSLDSLDKVVELEDQDCPVDELETFYISIVVQLSETSCGESSFAKQNDLMMLSTAITKSFNNGNLLHGESYCDLTGRRIVAVTPMGFEFEGSGDTIQDLVANDLGENCFEGTVVSTIRLHITSECVGCNGTLFDNEPVVDDQVVRMRQLEGHDERDDDIPFCFCPVNVTSQQGLNQSKFSEYLQDTISVLQVKEDIPWSLNEILDVQPIVHFSTSYNLDLCVSSSLSAESLTLLEELFRVVYNEWIDSASCDSVETMIVSVDFLTTDVGPIHDGSGGSQRLEAVVQGTCFGDACTTLEQPIFGNCDNSTETAFLVAYQDAIHLTEDVEVGGDCGGGGGPDPTETPAPTEGLDMSLTSPPTESATSATTLSSTLGPSSAPTAGPTTLEPTSAPTLANPGCLENGEDVDFDLNTQKYCETCTDIQTLELECGPGDYDCDCIEATTEEIWGDECLNNRGNLRDIYDDLCVTPEPTSSPTIANPGCLENGEDVDFDLNTQRYCETCTDIQTLELECGPGEYDCDCIEDTTEEIWGDECLNNRGNLRDIYEELCVTPEPTPKPTPRPTPKPTEPEFEGNPACLSGDKADDNGEYCECTPVQLVELECGEIGKPGWNAFDCLCLLQEVIEPNEDCEPNIFEDFSTDVLNETELENLQFCCSLLPSECDKYGIPY